MSFWSSASGQSLWRGIDYYHNKRVVSFTEISSSEFEADVSGSGDNIYHVYINTDHPRKTSCNCPFADGRRVICKHAIATFFTIFPEAEEILNKEIEEWNNQVDRERYQYYLSVKECVDKLPIDDLRRQLYTRIVSENYEYDYVEYDDLK